MKISTIASTCCLLLIGALSTLVTSAQIGIGIAVPTTSAQLEVASTTRGILVPRMSSAQRTSISTPAEGLLVYQNDGSKGFYYYDQTAVAWRYIGSSLTSWSVTGNSGTTASTSAIGTAVNNNFIGTTDANDFVVATNNLERLRISSAGNVGVGTIAPAQKLELSNGNLLISNSTNTSGELRIAEPSSSGSNYTAFKAQAQSGDITYTLPSSLPTTASYALISDLSGNLSWGVGSLGTSMSQTLNFEDFVFDAYAGNGSNDNQFAFTQFTSGGTSDVDGGGALLYAGGNDYAGIHVLNTGTTTSGRAGLASFNNYCKMKIGGKQIIFEIRARVENISDATNAFTVYYGLMDSIGSSSILTSASGDPNNGVYFKYTHANNSGRWQGVTRTSTGTLQTVNSTVTVTANQWYRLKAVCNATGTQVDFYIDDVLIGSNTTNLPTNKPVKFVFKLEKSAGTTARTTSIDYIGWRMER